MNLNLTSGEMLFYGGIIGMVIVTVVSIVFITILGNGKKRLRCKFDIETKNIRK